MNIKIMNALLIFSLQTAGMQAVSINLYNNSGEPLSISFTHAQGAQKAFSTQTLDYKVKINMLALEDVEEIIINKPNNQSVTISGNTQEEKDPNFKTCTVRGHTTNGANYSYQVQYKTILKMPYLIIDADAVYGYKISTKNFGAST